MRGAFSRGVQLWRAKSTFVIVMQLNTGTILQFLCWIFVYLYICNFLSTRETKSTFGRLWCNLTKPHNNCGQCSLICLAILFLLSHDNNTPQSSHIGGRKQQCSFNNVAQWTLHRYGSGSTIPFSFFGQIEFTLALVVWYILCGNLIFIAIYHFREKRPGINRQYSYLNCVHLRFEF